LANAQQQNEVDPSFLSATVSSSEDRKGKRKEHAGIINSYDKESPQRSLSDYAASFSGASSGASGNSEAARSEMSKQELIDSVKRFNAIVFERPNLLLRSAGVLTVVELFKRNRTTKAGEKFLAVLQRQLSPSSLRNHLRTHVSEFPSEKRRIDSTKLPQDGKKKKTAQTNEGKLIKEDYLIPGVRNQVLSELLHVEQKLTAKQAIRIYGILGEHVRSGAQYCGIYPNDLLAAYVKRAISQFKVVKKDFSFRESEAVRTLLSDAVHVLKNDKTSPEKIRYEAFKEYKKLEEEMKPIVMINRLLDDAPPETDS
jgi:hypothetical protein